MITPVGHVALQRLAALCLPLALALFLGNANSSLASQTDSYSTPQAQIQYTLQVYAMVNKLRAAHHLRKLKVDAKLAKGARLYSQKMVTQSFYSHVEPGGGTFERRFLRSGYVPRGWVWGAGENLAWSGGQGNPAERVFQAWLHSAPHRANMLIRDWTHMGAGFVPGNPYKGSMGSTWTIWFAERIRFS